MAKLILSMDSVLICDYALTKDRMTVGRKPGNDIQVDNLAVSGEHAVILTSRNDSFIEDLNSTNGTFVNGKPVRRHLLQNGDVMEFGKHKLKYIDDGKTPDVAADFERTLGSRSSLTKPSPPEADAPPLDVEEVRQSAVAMAKGSSPTTVVTRPRMGAESVSNPIGAIQVLSGGGAGRTLELNKDLTTIGKSGGDVAVVTRRPGGYYITPVEGKPPMLNGRTMDAQAHLLGDHDIIEMAGVRLEFYLKA